METYYDILQIEKNASNDEIKRAYRKLAIKYHPDKNPNDTAIFIKIKEAYETLIDPIKRSTYDMEINDDDIFSNMSNIFGNKENMNLQQVLLNDFLMNNMENIKNMDYDKMKENILSYFKENFDYLKKVYNMETVLFAKLIKSILISNSGLKDPDLLHYTLNVSLEDLFQQKIKKIKVSRKIRCKKCNGRTCFFLCKKCNHIESHNFICEKCCNFSLTKINCDCATGHSINSKVFEIPLNIGILDNRKFLYENEGNYLSTYNKPGSVLITVKYQQHREIQVKEKKHLICEKKLSLYEWLYKYEININHPNGKIIKLTNSGIVMQNIVKLEDKGLKNGHMYVILILDTAAINEDDIYTQYLPLNESEILSTEEYDESSVSFCNSIENLE